MHELFNSLVELIKDLHNRCSELLALGITDFDLLELVELNDGAGKVHNILAALLERVEAHEEGICCNLPLVSTLGLTLVFKVGILKL
jgi:hypothetical protein